MPFWGLIADLNQVECIKFSLGKMRIINLLSLGKNGFNLRPPGFALQHSCVHLSKKKKIVTVITTMIMIMAIRIIVPLLTSRKSRRSFSLEQSTYGALTIHENLQYGFLRPSVGLS